jgi:hypothetical protein
MIPSSTVTVEFASALPLKAGVVLLVETFAAGVVIEGAAGAAVSTVKPRTAEPTFPAPSVPLTVTLCSPSVSGAGVNGDVHAASAPPSTAQVAVSELASETVKTTLGVLLDIDAPSSGELIVTTGWIVSIVNETVALPTFPA